MNKQALQAQARQMLNYRNTISLVGESMVAGSRMPWQDESKAYLTALASGTFDPENAPDLARQIEDAWQSAPASGVHQWGNPARLDTPMHALAAARIEHINNFVVGMPSFMTWYFEQIPLAADEQPYVVNETNNEIGLTYISFDGTPVRQTVTPNQQRTPIGLRTLSTNVVRYKTWDVYKGNVSALTAKTIDLARDLRIKLDLDHFALVNQLSPNGGVFGPFSYEQGNVNPALRVYVPHSSILTVHFPTTNDYDLTQAPGSAQNPMGESTSFFDIPVLRATMDYAARWGDIFEGGTLVPSGEILVPASDIIAIAEQFAPVANTNAQDLQAGINANGYMSVDYLGVKWKFVPSMFIPKGTCYPRFNKMPGVSFFKSMFDREFIETNLRENWEERSMQKVYGAYIITARRQWALRIKYSNAGSSSH